MNKALFFEFLKLKWAKKKRKVFPKGLTWLFPGNVERKYFEMISGKIRSLTKVTQFYLKDMKLWLKPNFKNDSEVKDLREALQRAYDEGFKDTDLENTVLGYGLETNAYNKKQWEKFSILAIGFAFVGNEEWLGKTLEEWVALNKILLSKLGSDYMSQINLLVSKAVQQGYTYKYLAEQIQKTNSSFTKRRAKLMARDQIGTLNGIMTKYRQLDAGIEQYTWNTAQDERVRGNPAGKYPKAIPSHWIMQGKICKWEDSSVFSDDGEVWKKRTDKMPKTIVSVEILCRCSGIPRIQELLNRVE